MPRKIALDENELPVLRALAASDPEAEFWTMAHALDTAAFGADFIASTLSGKLAVLRRLAGRKLVLGESGVSGEFRGWAILPKGTEALNQRVETLNTPDTIEAT